jgi:hypothetical protein
VVCFRYASWIDIESDTCFRNITWGSLPIGCQGVVRKDALEAAKVRPKMFTTIVKLLRKLKKIKKNLILRFLFNIYKYTK